MIPNICDIRVAIACGIHSWLTKFGVLCLNQIVPVVYICMIPGIIRTRHVAQVYGRYRYWHAYGLIDAALTLEVESVLFLGSTYSSDLIF